MHLWNMHMRVSDYQMNYENKTARSKKYRP